MNKNALPLVSICCVTYNHAPFIRKSLDGMLMQQGVAYEILIHDDCSTDGTTEIVREYAEKYPDVIFPLYEKENQFCKPGRESMDFYNYRRARGKYIAYCEGDDYWTDSLKLKKQVEWMEAHDEYSCCFMRNDVYDGFLEEMIPYDAKADLNVETEITKEDYLYMREHVMPMSLVFRTDKLNYEWNKHYTAYCDTMEIYHLLRIGKGVVLNQVCGVYNRHSGGVSSSNTAIRNSCENVRDAWEMYSYIGDFTLKTFFLQNIIWRLDVCHESAMRKQYWQTYLFALHCSPRIALKVAYKRIKRRIKDFIR